jgi:hypothetical protein
MKSIAHEVTTAFGAIGLPLSNSLADMLDEHFRHHTARRGCGFTQATRFISTFINQTRDPLAVGDLSVFQEWPLEETEQIAHDACIHGWERGWRALDEAPLELVNVLPCSKTITKLRLLPEQIRAIRDQVANVESRLFVRLLEHTITGGNPKAPKVPGMPIKPNIGSCSQAEEFFLEVAHSRIRRHGRVNIIVDEARVPVMVEKIGLGESHSAMVISAICINSVLIPPGSLCALKYKDNEIFGIPTPHGHAFALSDIEQARFLRLTTFAVPPAARERAFSVQLEAQVRSDFFSPLSTSIEHLQAFASQELESAR